MGKELKSKLMQPYTEIDRVTADVNPLLSAGVLMASALRIYKTVLTPQEFAAITEFIRDQTDEIEPIEPVPTRVGERWFDSSEGVMYEYVNDGTSGAWLDIGAGSSSNMSSVYVVDLQENAIEKL